MPCAEDTGIGHVLERQRTQVFSLSICSTFGLGTEGINYSEVSVEILDHAFAARGLVLMIEGGACLRFRPSHGRYRDGGAALHGARVEREHGPVLVLQTRHVAQH